MCDFRTPSSQRVAKLIDQIKAKRKYNDWISHYSQANGLQRNGQTQRRAMPLVDPEDNSDIVGFIQTHNASVTRAGNINNSNNLNIAPGNYMHSPSSRLMT